MSSSCNQDLAEGPMAWGRTLKVYHRSYGFHDRNQLLPTLGANENSMLAYGNGRSYGDVALNPNGGLLKARGLDRFIDFDPSTGILRCEAGVLLDDILSLIVPQGWFLAVTPGTRYVTVGGAIANDVHGKNHHRKGCFSSHVRCFELLRSDGSRLECCAQNNTDWFAATCGGLGLTGLITWAELKLRRIANSWMLGFQERFENVDRFFQLSREADRDYEYSVAWIDCASRGRQLGRGIFMAANHAPSGFVPPNIQTGLRSLKFPFTPPVSLVNRLSLKAFNTLYFHRIRKGRQPLIQHFNPFFYPLDGILEWNRMYGPKGFHQYQCVIPDFAGISPQDTIKALLTTISESGQGSFLAVLKVCGDVPSQGLLSFPMAGVSLALDFPEAGPSLHALFSKLDALVLAAKGRLYPAKDSRMPAKVFQSSYPAVNAFKPFIDPRFSSSFWRRVQPIDLPEKSCSAF